MASEENKNTFKRTGSVDLDSILKQKELLYGNTPAGVQVFKAIYNLKGIEKTVAAKILTVDHFEEVDKVMEEVAMMAKVHTISRFVTIDAVRTLKNPDGYRFDIILI